MTSSTSPLEILGFFLRGVLGLVILDGVILAPEPTDFSFLGRAVLGVLGAAEEEVVATPSVQPRPFLIWLKRVAALRPLARPDFSATASQSTYELR